MASGVASSSTQLGLLLLARCWHRLRPTGNLYRRITTQRYSKVGSSEKRIKAQLKCSLRKFINDSEEGRVYFTRT